LLQLVTEQALDSQTPLVFDVIEDIQETQVVFVNLTLVQLLIAAKDVRQISVIDVY
jgi:hypothetical protein